MEPQKLTRRSFRWTDAAGQEHKLADIDDRYLSNIINLLKRRLADTPLVEDMYVGDDWWTMCDNEQLIGEYEELIEFLEKEQKRRLVGATHG